MEHQKALELLLDLESMVELEEETLAPTPMQRVGFLTEDLSQKMDEQIAVFKNLMADTQIDPKDITLYVDDAAFYKHLPAGITRQTLDDLEDYARVYQALGTIAVSETGAKLVKEYPSLRTVNVELPLHHGLRVQVGYAPATDLLRPAVHADITSEFIVTKPDTPTMTKVRRYLADATE